MKARPLEWYDSCLVNACRGRLPQYLCLSNMQVSRQKPGQLLLFILSRVLELSLLYPSKQVLQWTGVQFWHINNSCARMPSKTLICHALACLVACRVLSNFKTCIGAKSLDHLLTALREKAHSPVTSSSSNLPSYSPNNLLISKDW